MRTLTFVGPSGPYGISLQDDTPSLEDQWLVVDANGETSHWGIEIDEIESGIRKLAGMTRDGSGLWFELWLGSVPEVHYWGNRQLVRVDRASAGEVC
ncbi:MAG: hypothetical protein ACKVP3_26840 [Hyphomicrobiaceae bacterium]